MGAQDGLIFDGGGFVNQNGRLMLELPRFQRRAAAAWWTSTAPLRLRTENTTWRDDRKSCGRQRAARCTFAAWPASPAAARASPTRRRRTGASSCPRGALRAVPRERYCEDLLDALALGVGDYFEKTRAFSCIGIALSGGRDSLLTLLIAHRYAASAAPRLPIETFYMPTRFSSRGHPRGSGDHRQGAGRALHRASPSTRPSSARWRRPRRCWAPGGELTPITRAEHPGAAARAAHVELGQLLGRPVPADRATCREKAVGYTTIGGDLMGALAVIANLPKTVVMYLLDYLQREARLRGHRAGHRAARRARSWRPTRWARTS